MRADFTKSISCTFTLHTQSKKKENWFFPSHSIITVSYRPLFVFAKAMTWPLSRTSEPCLEFFRLFLFYQEPWKKILAPCIVMIRIYLQFSIVHKVTKRLLRNLQLHCKFIPWQITTIWHGVSFAFVTKDLWNIPGCFAWFFLWGTLLLKRHCRSGHPQKRVHCKNIWGQYI